MYIYIRNQLELSESEPYQMIWLAMVGPCFF